MRPLGVEPGEPVEQALVEAWQVVEEQLLVHIEELLLHRAVEALAVGIHFRSAREGVPVEDLAVFQGAVEMLGELLTVVREHAAHRSGEEALV